MFDNKNTLVYVLLAVVVFFLLSNKMKESFNSGSNLKGCYKMDTNMCSPDCCGKQWPVSFDLKRDSNSSGELKCNLTTTF